MSMWNFSRAAPSEAEKQFTEAAQALVNPVLKDINKRLESKLTSIVESVATQGFVGASGTAEHRHEAQIGLVVERIFLGRKYYRKVADLLVRSAPIEGDGGAPVQAFKMSAPLGGVSFSYGAPAGKDTMRRIQLVLHRGMERLPYVREYGL